MLRKYYKRFKDFNMFEAFILLFVGPPVVHKTSHEACFVRLADAIAKQSTE